MPEPTFEFCRLSLCTAQKCFFNNENDECYDICHQLLEITTIDMLFRAGAHCLLACSTHDPVWHAERAVDQYQELLEEHPGDEKLTRYLGIAEKLLVQTKSDEEELEEKELGDENIASPEVESEEEKWRFSVPIKYSALEGFPNCGSDDQNKHVEESVASSQRTVSPEIEQGEQGRGYEECTDYNSDDENEHMEMLMVSGVGDENPFEGEICWFWF